MLFRSWSVDTRQYAAIRILRTFWLGFSCEIEFCLAGITVMLLAILQNLLYYRLFRDVQSCKFRIINPDSLARLFPMLNVSAAQPLDLFLVNLPPPKRLSTMRADQHST